MTDRLSRLLEELEEERRLHTRSKLGLEKLRLHFSQSLPLSAKEVDSDAATTNAAAITINAVATTSGATANNS